MKNMTRKRYSKSPYFVYYLHHNIISRETTCDSTVLRDMGFARQPHNAHYAATSKASGFRRPLACVSEPAHPNYTRNVRTSISRWSRKIADQVFALPALLALFFHVIQKNLTNFTSTPVL